MRAPLSTFLVGIVIGVWSQAAIAQTPPPHELPAPKQEDESLSDRLSRDKGVIRPPDVEQPNDMEVKPPDTQSKMPVIPPPGSPGGDESVDPK